MLNVIGETRKQDLQQKTYTGIRTDIEFKGELMIPYGSIYKQIVVDFVGDGLGQWAAMYFVNNRMLHKEGKEMVKRSTIWYTVLCLWSKKVKKEIIPQGNQCAHST